ncbi:MAG: hypothetical protein NTV68_02995 [Methanomicrobiales archaeon]|nr:hypothetical protein [Methanomicrobiales archaeon]
MPWYLLTYTIDLYNGDPDTRFSALPDEGTEQLIRTGIGLNSTSPLRL